MMDDLEARARNIADSILGMACGEDRAWTLIADALTAVRAETTLAERERAALKVQLLVEELDRKFGEEACNEVAAAIRARTATQGETCHECQGSGYGGHPDSGALCVKCSGTGSVAHQPVAHEGEMREKPFDGPIMAHLVRNNDELRARLAASPQPPASPSQEGRVSAFTPEQQALQNEIARRSNEHVDEQRRAVSASPSPEGRMHEAARDVLAERERQKASEGWTAEHDDKYVYGQLARAGACYAVQNSRQFFEAPTHEDSGWEEIPPPFNWPWPRDAWKPKDRRRNLVRAGALIIAEIERLDRKREGRE